MVLTSVLIGVSLACLALTIFGELVAQSEIARLREEVHTLASLLDRRQWADVLSHPESVRPVVVRVHRPEAGGRS